ncbi:MAG: hypothetical protein JXA35_00505 [Deltaproteobacteria bacterium]|nr:hypothetical protein [Deltaproteobacteria bacterium]
MFRDKITPCSGPAVLSVGTMLVDTAALSEIRLNSHQISVAPKTIP